MPKRSQSSQGIGHRKRAKASPPPDQGGFSLGDVVANLKKAAVQHAHLPETVISKLFEQDATISYLTTDHKSWVYHVPRWYWHVFKHATPEDLRLADEDTEEALTWSALFMRAWEAHPKQHDTIMMFGKPAKLPRFQQLCGEMGSYRYSGKTFEAQQKFPPGLRHAVHQMQRIVENPTTQHHTRLTGGLVNWYENGDHYIGPHADDERDMMSCSPIVALSLGATRRFVFTKKASKTAPQGEEAVARMELQIKDGDLMIMGGTTQRTHKHAVPKMARCRDPRISVTLRCFV